MFPGFEIALESSAGIMGLFEHKPLVQVVL